MPRMRLLLISYLFFVISFDLTAQKGREKLSEAAILLNQHKKIADSTVTALIQIKEDRLTKDSVKVEIVHFLADLACDTCLLYLIEHMDDRFNYGSGGSDVDQFNYIACLGLLAQLAEQDNTKWKILASIFQSLKLKNREDAFFSNVRIIALTVTSKTIIKSIIEDELSNSSTRLNKIYVKNLTGLLERISK